MFALNFPKSKTESKYITYGETKYIHRSPYYLLFLFLLIGLPTELKAQENPDPAEATEAIESENAPDGEAADSRCEYSQY